MTADPSIHALIPIDRLQNPEAFTQAHLAAQSTDEQDRGAALVDLVHETPLEGGGTLADEVLNQAVIAETEGTTGLDAKRLEAAHAVSGVVLDVVIDRGTSELTGVFRRTQAPGPSPEAVKRKQASLRSVPSGPTQNSLSGGAAPSSLVLGSRVTKVA